MTALAGVIKSCVGITTIRMILYQHATVIHHIQLRTLLLPDLTSILSMALTLLISLVTVAMVPQTIRLAII